MPPEQEGADAPADEAVLQPDAEVPAEDAVVEAAPEGDADGQEAEAGAEDAPVEAKAEGEGDPAPETPEPAKKPKRNVYQERIAQLSREKEALRRQVEAAQAGKPDETDTGEPKTFTEAEVQARIRAEADRLADAKTLRESQVNAENAIFEKGMASHTDFEAARDNLVGLFGDQIAQRPDFIEALTELPNAHDVFHHLGTDLDAASDLFAMRPAKMAIKLAQMSAELAKPKGVKIPDLPAPVRPVRGSTRVEHDLYDPKININDFVRIRDKEEAERRATQH